MNKEFSTKVTGCGISYRQWDNEFEIKFIDCQGYTLGMPWRIKAKNNDFFIEPAVNKLQQYLHLSLHGPGKNYPSKRFHLKISERNASNNGVRLFHSQIPKDGAKFTGQQISENVWHVIRFRWPWVLQKQKYASLARIESTRQMSIAHEHTCARRLQPNSYWDIDLIVSTTHPYWRGEEAWSRESAKLRNARIGPLQNDSGMWLTATSHHRSGLHVPSPPHIVPRATPSQPANAYCGQFLGIDENDIYWIVSTIADKRITESDQERRAIWPDLYTK